MAALGVQRATDGQLLALVEIDRNHCGTCFADGIQMATGCTFGKGNIQSLGYGKHAVTLIDTRTGRSVRVVAKPETVQRSRQSEFMKYRRTGTPASQIDSSLVEPMIDMMLTTPAEEIFRIGPVEQREVSLKPHSFDSVTCAKCGEAVVEPYARVKGGQIVCIPCAEKA
jgi:formylmethanofuran dehydrogenase subunit E